MALEVTKLIQPISDEELLKAQACFEGLIDKVFSTSKRSKQLMSMLFEKGVSARYYNEPASQYENYHCAFKGGLLIHSLTVTSFLYKLANVYSLDDKESMTFAGLFHDLGKIGDEDGPQYLPQEDSWWIEKRGQFYEWNNDITSMPHSIRSLYILQHFGVPVTKDEYTAIAFHDGLYSPLGETIKNREEPLTIALHHADKWSAHQAEVNLNSLKKRVSWEYVKKELNINFD